MSSNLGALLTAAVLATTAGFGAALINPVGQQGSNLRRSSPGGVVGRGSISASKVPLGIGSGVVERNGGFGNDAGKRGQSASSRSDSPVVLSQSFWDSLAGASGGGNSGGSKKGKTGKGQTFKSPLPKGFPPASTLVRPEPDESLGHFLDVTPEKFIPNKPSWWQGLRFRTMPLGRISPRTRVMKITLGDRGPLNLVSKGQLFGTPELDLYGCTTALKTAAHDPRIRGVLMELSAEEMSMATIMEIRRAMDYFTQSGKPLWGFTEDTMDITLLCLMGGCTRRVAAPEVYVNFVGFSFDSEFYRGVLDKVGIEPQIRRIGEFKSFGDAYARDSMSVAQREVTESLLSAVSGFKTGLLARDAGRKSIAEVEAIYNSDEPVTVGTLKDFGLIDDVYYEDQMLSLLNQEMNKRYKMEVAAKPWNRMTRGAKVPFKKSRKTRLIDPSKTIVPVSTYLKRTKRNMVEGVPGRKGDKTIAVINAEGAIVNAGGSSSGNLVVESFRQQANTILRDSDVSGVVVRISSPGGDALASDLMWREVRRLRESGKVVVASVSSVAASGGYYIAMGCETIVCDELSITGSIGVVVGKANFGELLDKVGFKIERISKGKYSELFAPERSFTPAEDAYWSRNAMISYNDFVSKAALSRRMPLEDMQRRAQGRVWTGAQAKTLGLVDELGGLERAIELCREKVELKELAKKKVSKARRAAEVDRKKREKEEKKTNKNKPVVAEEGEKDEVQTTAKDTDVGASGTMAIVKSKAGGEEGGEKEEDDSGLVLSDEEIPFGPLGIFPERYSQLEAQAVKEAEEELRSKFSEDAKKGKRRLTRVKNIQPSPTGLLGLLGASARSEDFSDDESLGFGAASPGASRPSANTLLKGLGSLTSPEASRPMAVMDDNLARVLPGVSGVPKDLKRLGVGPLLYSLLLKSPGLADSLVEMLGRVGLSSLLLD